MPTSLENSRTQQEHCILASRQPTAITRIAEGTPPAMRMRRLNAPHRDTNRPTYHEETSAKEDRVQTAEERNNALFDALWQINEQNKENALREWGGGGGVSASAPRQLPPVSPAAGTLARPREVSSMPVPSARKRSASPSYDPPCKKALSYDHPILAVPSARSPLGSSQSSTDSPPLPNGRLRSPLTNGNRRTPVFSPTGARTPLSNATTPVRHRPHLKTNGRVEKRPCIGRSDPLLSSEQKMQRVCGSGGERDRKDRLALDIRPSLVKNGRTLTERLKNSKLLHDVVLPSGPTILTSHNADVLTGSDEILAELLQPADSTSANPFLVEEEEVVSGPFAAREETVTFLSSQELEEPCEPHAIGFFNPGNLCWMNAVIQCVISLSPLMGDIQEHMVEGADQPSASKYSNVLRGLIKILSVRRQGMASRVNDSLRKFHKSLEALKPQFATDTQQDCPEFLTELLDHLRDEFYRLARSSGAVTLREISDNAPGALRDATPNPVRDNTEIAMRQHKTCINCSEMVVGEIREPILIVDVPTIPKCSLQHALKGYFKSADIERQCDSCGAKTSRTTTAVSRLPRVLTVQLKRYICKERTPESTFSGIEKVNSRVRIPEWLSVQDIITDDVQLPSVRVMSAAPSPLAVYLDESSNQEDRELEEAKQRSMETEDTEEEQLRQALAASMLDAPRSLPGSLTNTPVKDGGTPVKDDDPTHTQDYRLVAFIQHMGINPNSGHYMATVYNFPHNCWINYNDAEVVQHTFFEATSDRAQRNGYIFFYLHRSQFEAQAATEGADKG